MAHYALGRYEHELGHQLDWRGRSEFIRKYLAEHDPEFLLKEDEQ